MAEASRRRGTRSTPQTWTCRFMGHDYELDVTPGLSTRLVLRMDGEQRYDKTSMQERRDIKLGVGRRVEVVLSKTGSVRRATVHETGAGDLDFDAPRGSRAARLQVWGREHPMLYAIRHVVITVGGWAIALLGLGALFKALLEPLMRWISEHMPDIDWPEIHLPRIPWPDIRLPRIPFPDIEPPWWFVAFFDWIEPYEDFAKALIFGIVLAIVELRRQRRQKRLREGGEMHRAARSTTPSRAATAPEGASSPDPTPADDEAPQDDDSIDPHVRTVDDPRIGLPLPLAGGHLESAAEPSPEEIPHGARSVAQPHVAVESWRGDSNP